MKKFFIIDGNGYMHRAYHALPKFTTPDGKPSGALFGFLRMLLKIIKKEKPDYLAVAFDSKHPTERQKKFEEYKAQRPKTDDELISQLKEAKKFVEALGVKAIVYPGWEADDIIASLCEKFKRDLKIFVVSSDKDISQIVGENILLYNEMKDQIFDEKGIFSKYGVEPQNFVDWLALTGDSSDNIPGASGIGPVTATKLIKEFKTVENLYENLNKLPTKISEKLSASKDNVFLSKQLVTLRKDIPIDFKIEDFKYELNKENLIELARKWDFKSILREYSDENEFVLKVEAKYEKDPQKFLSRDELYINFIEEKNSRGFVIAGENQAIFLPENPMELSFKEQQGIVERILSQKKKVLTNDSKFLIKFALSKSLEIQSDFTDLSLMGYVIDSKPDQSMPSLSRKFLKKDLPQTKDFVQLAKNSVIAFELKKVLSRIIEKEKLNFLYEEIELPLSKILAYMEYWGIKVDSEIFKNLSRKLDERIKELEAEIYNLAGMKFNIRSPIELRNVIFGKLNLPILKKTKTGPSLDSEVLGELAPLHPICRKIIVYRTFFKLKSTYVDVFPHLIADDGRIHTNFNPTGTLTGRLSSSQPNLQNIPARGEWATEIRRAFIPEKGNVFLSADYSQIDLRVMAHFSKDMRLLKAFQNDEDIHIFTAQKIFNLPKEKITPHQRKIAKTINFGIIYGMGVWGLSADLGITKEEAKEFISNYWKTFPQVKKFTEKCVKDAQEKGYTETIFKRKRIVYGRSSFEQRVAINTPIQGSSSDIIKKAMVEIFPELFLFDAKLILQIHDELLFEVPESKVKEFANKVKKVMENAVKLEVPLKVNLKKGKNFGDVQEFKI